MALNMKIRVGELGTLKSTEFKYVENKIEKKKKVCECANPEVTNHKYALNFGKMFYLFVPRILFLHLLNEDLILTMLYLLSLITLDLHVIHS